MTINWADGVCLDANIIINALLQNPQHAQCMAILRRCADADTPLRSPALLVFEVTSVLHRKVHERLLTSQHAQEALGHFYQLPFLLEWHRHCAVGAQNLAQRMGEKLAYDASYLAVAIHHDIPLITLDANLLKRGRKIYPKIFSPEDVLN